MARRIRPRRRASRVWLPAPGDPRSLPAHGLKAVGRRPTRLRGSTKGLMYLPRCAAWLVLLVPNRRPDLAPIVSPSAEQCPFSIRRDRPSFIRIRRIIAALTTSSSHFVHLSYPVVTVLPGLRARRKTPQARFFRNLPHSWADTGSVEKDSRIPAQESPVRPPRLFQERIRRAWAAPPAPNRN